MVKGIPAGQLLDLLEVFRLDPAGRLANLGPVELVPVLARLDHLPLAGAAIALLSSLRAGSLAGSALNLVRVLLRGPDLLPLAVMARREDDLAVRIEAGARPVRIPLRRRRLDLLQLFH
jgi:hypothetical protein